VDAHLDHQALPEIKEDLENPESQESKEPWVFLEPLLQLPPTPMDNAAFAPLDLVALPDHAEKLVAKDLRDPRDLLDAMETMDPQDHKDPRDLRETRDPMVALETQDKRETMEPVEQRDPMDHPDPRDQPGPKDHPVHKDLSENLETLADKDLGDPLDHRDPLANPATQDPRDLLASLAAMPATAHAQEESNKLSGLSKISHKIPYPGHAAFVLFFLQYHSLILIE
jgi:hypothetical protein